MIKIDARQLTGGINYANYIADYFAGLPQGASVYHGGEPDVAFGSEFYVSGPQVSFTYGEEADQMVLLNGEEIAYDFIHHGAQFGHGISGEINEVVFGTQTEETGTDDGTENGMVTGLTSGLVVSGLNITSEPGEGNVEANDVYWLYAAMQRAGSEGAERIAAIYDAFSSEAQLFRGSNGADTFRGGAFDDNLIGGRGADVLSGSQGNDTITGGRDADTLNGGNGDDVLNGGAGNDILVGGAGNDTFVFGADAGGRDTIRDFADGDLIDVSAFDLTLISGQFSGEAAELRLVERDGFTNLAADTDGDGASDFTIKVNAVGLTADDFLF